MNSWRRHQKDLITIGGLMKFNPKIKTVYCLVTPGGGKSALPLILAHNLIPVRGDRIAWLTPRDNLRTQGEKTFLNNRFRALLGHALEIRATEPEADPCRGAAGFISTYQSAVSDAKCNRFFQHEFRKHRYVLILDEPHHLALLGEFHKAVQPLYDSSCACLFMSGCFDRSDNERIAFLPYLPPDQDGKSYVDFSDTEHCRFITYDLRDALQEHAIIPMWFQLLDGNAKWEKSGDEFDERISEVENGEIGSAIYTTLRTDFAHHLLRQTVEHWLLHRDFNRRSQLLVVAPSIALAKKYLGWLRKMGAIKCDIAVSEDSKLARDNIDLFKDGKLHALVTVAMAYEGMDVPAATHIACLTHIRARPWIEQMLARATRYDEKAGPWEQQKAWVFAPDDKLFQEVMADMNDIQRPFVEEIKLGGGGGGGGPSLTTPISSEANATRGAALDPAEQIEANEHADLTDAMKAAGLYGIATEYQIKKVLDEAAKQKTNPQRNNAPEADIKPISIREKELRDKINKWVNARWYSDGNGDVLKGINTEIMRRYGKSRSVMNEQELQVVWDQRAVWAAQFLRQANEATG